MDLRTSNKLKESNTVPAVGGFQTLKAFGTKKQDNKNEQVKSKL